MVRIQRALISVSDKTGLREFARGLADLGIELISTGGTLKFLLENGLTARAVSDVTGFPEILDGRVKTLHPKIHGALLALPEKREHMEALRAHAIDPIDMVVVNLYPFERTIAQNNVTIEQALEQIDIGGPSMLRSAAKNFHHKAVVVSPERYEALLDELLNHDRTLSTDTCADLAREVFRHTSRYDAAIAEFLGSAPGLPPSFHSFAPKELDLRYGENPHQHGALYGMFGTIFRKLHGKELSFNNIVDIAAAAQLVAEFDEPTVAIVKHTNPCGVGSGHSLSDAYVKAFATDTKSPFGGIVAVNRPLDLEAARKINEVFTEVVIAPDFATDALEFLRAKKDRRLIHCTGDVRSQIRLDVRSVPGGFLVQEPDIRPADAEEFTVVTRRKPDEAETAALRFAWRVAKHVKSNAIVYARADRTLGIGAGQMSRVDSSRLAVLKAREEGCDLAGSAVGSDAFFPFADGLLEAVHAGSTAVIQPGGSVRDQEVIRAADDHNIAMVFTGTRHFRH